MKYVRNSAKAKRLPIEIYAARIFDKCNICSILNLTDTTSITYVYLIFFGVQLLAVISKSIQEMTIVHFTIAFLNSDVG